MSHCAGWGCLLSELYDSEISFTLLGYCWEAGFGWKLGDELNGYKATGYATSFDDAAWALAHHAFTHYPESDFTRKWDGAIYCHKHGLEPRSEWCHAS